MVAPLLTTKFHIPQQRVDLVPRPRLIERLNDGLRGKLILVCAPAGFGKTTVVTSWVGNELPGDYKGRVAWLSLDEKVDGFTLFFSYFIVALQNVEPEFGEELRHALSGSQNPQAEVLLPLLINEIAAIEENFILILDDYHLITSLEIHQALQVILENQPSNLLLVITSREEPFLPLSRLRARGQMVDLRARDLRFSRKEATRYLNQVMDLGLAEEDIQALESRTEGWITGLRLAALSMQGQDNPKSFIAEFAGDDRYIIDYLVDEVFLHRSEKSREFLRHTSILDHLTGSLCQAVTQQDDAQEILQKLEQENVFILPLDHRRQWYRYHHLFADVLRQRLAEIATPKEIENLHRRAGQWFEKKGSIIEAVEHAFEANDHEEVIRLIDLGVEEFFLNSQLNSLLAWHDRLPHNLIETHPKLCLIFGWAWVSTSKPEEAEHCLQSAEKALGVSLSDLLAAPSSSSIDITSQGALLETAVIRAQLAIGKGNFPEALELTNFALPYLADDDCPYLYNPPMGSRMAAYFIRGLALKLSGNLKNATTAFVEAGVLAKKLNHVHIVALAHGHLANVQAVQGWLYQALETCQHGLSEVEQMAGEKSPLSGVLQAEYGNLLYERNEINAAEKHLRESIRVAKPWGFLDAFIPGLTGLAQIHATRGDWQAAFEALDDLEELGRNNPQLVKPVVESWRALLRVRQGNLDQAQQWVDAAKLDSDGELAYHRECEFIILAQVLLAQKQLDDAEKLIERLLEIVRAGGRFDRVIKLLALRAILFQERGETDFAREYSNQAISLAASEGYVRTFLDLGPPMRTLLGSSVSTNPAYAKQLFVAFEPQIRPKDIPSSDGLAEPLSERELDVLHMLASELSGPEIAQELVIAVTTLRTHTQQIYRKLGVKNRRAALKEAEKLQLL